MRNSRLVVAALLLVAAGMSGIACDSVEPEATTPGVKVPGKGDSADSRDSATPRYFYVSAKNVENLGGSLSSVHPPVKTPDDPEQYLSSGSCLGDYGPIGAYGPLGTLGPVGDNTWNVSAWMTPISWDYWSNTLTAVGGPLSEDGPLGPNGPLGDSYYTEMPKINDFARQLGAGGVWAVLGPLGPLGALGPLGPLGPVGAHGFRSDADGQYRDTWSTVQRTVSVPYGSGKREYELFEKYTESFAKTFEDNDTSFMVTGEIDSEGDDTYAFTSHGGQFVTVLVVPEKQLDDFDLTLKVGRATVKSNSSTLIDWIHAYVDEDTQLEATVSLAASGHFLTKTYRLYVVGSTSAFTTTDITGKHQKSYSP